MFTAVILGPFFKDCRRYAKQLASRYKLVHVKMDLLVAYHLKNNTPFGEMLRCAETEGVHQFPCLLMFIADEACVDMLSVRLQEQDCRTRGWVVDGFPVTRQQAWLMLVKYLYFFLSNNTRSMELSQNMLSRYFSQRKYASFNSQF